MGQEEFYGEQYGHAPSSSEPINQQYYPDGNCTDPHTNTSKVHAYPHPKNIYLTFTFCLASLFFCCRRGDGVLFFVVCFICTYLEFIHFKGNVLFLYKMYLAFFYIIDFSSRFSELIFVGYLCAVFSDLVPFAFYFAWILV